MDQLRNRSHRDNRRAAARIVSEFMLAVEGVDQQLCPRRGNLSVSGVYFEADRPVGEPGSVQWLALAARDQTKPTEVLGRVIRVVTLDDLWREEPAVGIALEFMPDTQQKAADIERLVQRVVTLQLETDVEIRVNEEFDVLVSRKQPPPIPDAVEEPPLTVRKLMFETNQPLRNGSLVQLRLTPLDREESIFDGQVLESNPVPGAVAPPRHRVEAHVRRREAATLPDKRVGSSSISEAVELLFGGVAESSADERKSSRSRHMVGMLHRIRPASLLGLFELERTSGVLRLRQDDRAGEIYVDNGRLVDVTIAGVEQPARDALGELLGWSSGSFEFALQPVDRPDRLQSSTSALLLELAQAEDEAAAAAGQRDGAVGEREPLPAASASAPPPAAEPFAPVDAPSPNITSLSKVFRDQPEARSGEQSPVALAPGVLQRGRVIAVVGAVLIAAAIGAILLLRGSAPPDAPGGTEAAPSAAAAQRAAPQPADTPEAAVAAESIPAARPDASPPDAARPDLRLRDASRPDRRRRRKVAPMNPEGTIDPFAE